MYHNFFAKQNIFIILPFFPELIHKPKVSEVLRFHFEVLRTETEYKLQINCSIDRVSREAQDKEPLKAGHLDMSPSFLSCFYMTDSTHREFSMKRCAF